MKTINFAANELIAYGKLMHVDLSEIQLKVVEMKTHVFDDHFGYDIADGKGYIWGNNERSVLLSVYEFLKCLGVKFLSPGKKNEVIPKLDNQTINCKKRVVPKNRHRVMCLEGSVKQKHVLDMIDYIPKIGMNGYFIQFENPYEFYERYDKENNRDINISPLDSLKYKKELEKEIKRRGLIYHAVGHGWTTKALGLSGHGWYKSDINVLDETTQEMLALVNGKRDFFKGIPLNTQLCYSNLDVQNKMANVILNYLKNNKEIDVLHVWLADDFNNYCTCDSCKRMVPSNFYIDILNKVDILLSEHKIDTKISFLAYYELLWPPEHRLINEDRFILMFAPITRTFSYPMNEAVIKEEALEKFKLNTNKFPSNLGENIKYLNAWKKVFAGDSFIFDYHFMWDGLKEITNLTLSNVLNEDIRHLKKLGLNGFISCQLTRNSFPNALGLNVLGEALLNGIDDFDAFVKQYYISNYGDKGIKTLTFLQEIKDLFPVLYVRREISMKDESVLKQCDSCLSIVDKYLEVEFNNKSLINSYIKFIKSYLLIIKSKVSNDLDQAKKELKELLIDINKEREIIENDVDIFYIKHILNELIETEW